MVERLTKKHPSRPRNKHIAEAFFRAGYIESWGRGIEKILTAFQEAGLPEPIFEESWGGVMVTFLKDIYTEEYLQNLNLSERQIKALLYVKKQGELTNANYQAINEISKPVATRDLTDLVNRGLIVKVGSTGKGTKYILPKGS